MSKYGSGVSMKSHLSSELKEAQQILNKSNLSEEDKESVLSTIREIAYQWCTSNASACAIEELWKEKFPKEYEEMMQTFLKSNTFHRVYQQKLQETFPE